MKLVFVSNYMNHHQRPFLEQMETYGCQVYFVACEEISEERKVLGYCTDANITGMLRLDEENADEVYSLVMDADAVIFGSKPKKLFRARVRSGKLTFNASERLFKKSNLMAHLPYYKLKLRRRYLFDREHIPYLLTIGSYCVEDFCKLGYPMEKSLKWGYFPPLTEKTLPELIENKEKNTILWVGRFVPLKHPEYVVELAQYLKEQSLPFQIKMIGTGELWESIQKMIRERGLSDVVEANGPMPPEQVRLEFDKAQIALMTSDRNEGWGAVVDEAMSSACVMVAPNVVGSTTYLIENNVNGMVFENKQQMFQMVQQLLPDRERCSSLGKEAYRTITETWNYQTAAQRFWEFLQDQTVRYDSGPMSPN